MADDKRSARALASYELRQLFSNGKPFCQSVEDGADYSHDELEQIRYLASRLNHEIAKCRKSVMPKPRLPDDIEVFRAAAQGMPKAAPKRPPPSMKAGESFADIVRAFFHGK